MGRGHPGVPASHPARGAATQDHEGSELLRPRLAAHPRSERARGRGGTGRGQRSGPAATPPSRLVVAQAAGAGALEGWQGAF